MCLLHCKTTQINLWQTSAIGKGSTVQKTDVEQKAVAQRTDLRTEEKLLHCRPIISQGTCNEELCKTAFS